MSDSSINLTPREVFEITGKLKSSAQIAALRSLGFTFKIRPDGKPLISRSHFEIEMGGITSQTKAREYEPDFSSF